MKKLLSLLTFFTLLHSKISFAGNSTINTLQNCWECNIIEGVYIYVFNFVYKMYAVLVPIITNLLWLALAFWFIWYIWTNVIKAQKGDTGSMLKDVFIKLFTYTFVLSMLALPAKTIFKYSIDIIMNAGPNFARWVLTEARNDTEMLKLSNGQIRHFSCDDIKLSDYAKKALDNYAKADTFGDDYNEEEETLTNILCITREYTNTFNAGTDLGFKIMARSAIAMGEFKLAKLAYDSPVGRVSELAIQTALGPYLWIYSIVMFFVKIWLTLTFLANLVTFFIGLCITVGFLYILFTYLIMIFDIVIKLAMVGVMMPIAIGSWTFNNTRKQLSGKLFWDVVKCTFRIGCLSVSMTISTYLLNELFTTNFNAGSFDITITSLLEHLSGNGKIITSSTFLDGISLISKKNKILLTLITNPTIIISTLFVCLISFSLLSKSIQLADKFSSAIGSGVQNDTILNRLQKLTISTIRYINSGVSRELKSTLKYNWVNDKVNKPLAQPTKKDAEQKQQNGEELTAYDLPIDDAIDIYESDTDLNEINENTEAPDTKDSTTQNGGPSAPREYENISTDDLQKQYNNLSNKDAEQQERNAKIVDEAFKDYENYDKLTNEEKEKFQNDVAYLSNDDIEAELKNPSLSKEHKKFLQEIQSKTAQNNNTLNEVSKQINQKQIEKTLRNDKTISPHARKRIIKYLYNGGQLSASDRNLLDKCEAEVKSERKKEETKRKNIATELQYRQNNKLIIKPSNKIKAKDMYLILKNDEVNSINQEIENALNDDITTVSMMKISQLKRKLKKINKEFEALDEYDEETLEDITAREIKNYKRRKGKSKSPRIQKENDKVKQKI